MTEYKKQFRYHLAAFVLLFLVSLYRQISLRLLPEDLCRTWILYACYLFLIGAWVLSIQVRVTQKTMRRWLFGEAAMMAAGLSIRFLQDTFWTDRILLLRVSGLVIAATLLPMLLFGLYATTGTGQADDFRISPKWYLLCLPTLVMVLLILTDEKRHFVFYLLAQEAQPNLSFHPGSGAFLMIGFALLLMVWRVLLLFKRNHMVSDSLFPRWLVPWVEPLLMLLFTSEYFLVSLGIAPVLAGKEVIELYAKIYYAEVLTWEVYLYLGLVPANSEYQEIFRHATIGMQIIGRDGRMLSSEKAVPVDERLLEELKDKTVVEVARGKELHLYPLKAGFFLWNQDTTDLLETIDALNRSAEALAQDGILLEEELRTRNEETGLLVKNQIYDTLTGEITKQLKLMKEITRKKGVAEDKERLLRQLFLLGTYIKRRCNLRLIQKETGVITPEDLRLSFQDMGSALSLAGVPAVMEWEEAHPLTAGLSIWLFDMLEYFLEYERFSLKKVEIHACKAEITCTVFGPESDPPAECPVPKEQDGYRIIWEQLSGGFRMILRKGG